MYTTTYVDPREASDDDAWNFRPVLRWTPASESSLSRHLECPCSLPDLPHLGHSFDAPLPSDFPDCPGPTSDAPRGNRIESITDAATGETFEIIIMKVWHWSGVRVQSGNFIIKRKYLFVSEKFTTFPIFFPLVFWKRYLTSYFPMLLKKHMLTDPIVFEIIISQNQHN